MNNTVYYAGFILVGTFLSAVAQVLLKKSAMRQHRTFWREYLNSQTLFAYAVFLGTTLLSVYAMRGIPLSLAPILEATIYIYVAFFGVVVFKERLTWRKIMGLFLIVLGICVYAWWG